MQHCNVQLLGSRPNPLRHIRPFQSHNRFQRATSRSRARILARAESGDDSSDAQTDAQQPEVSQSTSRQPNRQRRQADSTDWFASTLTRRFGIAGGLAWLGILTFGVVSEQIKTRLEIASDERGTKDVTDAKEVKLPSGVQYTDLRIGGGQKAAPGLLLVLQLKLLANGELVQDSNVTGKPLVFIAGRRPLTGGLTPGAEEAVFSMKAGGKRRIVVPPALGFGKNGGVLRPTEHVPDKEGVIPPDAELEYEIELVRVSVSPS